jgi:transposase
VYDELAEVTVAEIWAGVDIAETHHHTVVINAEGERLLSRRILNDETELLALIGEVLALSDDVLWAVDLNHGGAALLIGLLIAHDQPVAHLTGLAVHRAAATYRGEGKTDAKDAFVIADQARVRRDVGMLRPGDEIAVDLRTLTTRRLDLVFDRTRQINRRRAQLREIFPALERSLDLTNKGPVMLLTGHQTPAAIRRTDTRRIETWLKNRQVKGAAALARTAVEAAQDQHTALPGEQLAAAMVVRLATGVMALDDEITELDALIETRFPQQPESRGCRARPTKPARRSTLPKASMSPPVAAMNSAPSLASIPGRLRITSACGLVAARSAQVAADAEEERGKATQAGSPRPRPPTRQRSVGDVP